MADRATEDKPTESRRKTFTAADVARLVDRQVPQVRDDQGRLSPRYDLLQPEWRPVYERLRRDPDGAVSAALNRLRPRNPELLLASLILAMRAAAALPRIPEVRAEAARLRERAVRLRAIATDYERDRLPGSIVLAARAQRELATAAEAQAERIENGLAAGPWSRKIGNQETAFLGAAIRDLARRIVGDGRADHAALARLLAAAIGRAVEAATVANALRSTVRTNARSKPKIGRERAFSKKCR